MQEVTGNTATIGDVMNIIGSFSKPHLTVNEACNYLGLSKGHLYKLTHFKKIPFSKPEGKKIYFQKTDLDAFVQRNKTKTAQAIDDRAASHVTLGRKRGGR